MPVLPVPPEQSCSNQSVFRCCQIFPGGKISPCWEPLSYKILEPEGTHMDDFFSPSNKITPKSTQVEIFLFCSLGSFHKKESSWSFSQQYYFINLDWLFWLQIICYNGLRSNVWLHWNGETHLVSSGTKPRQAMHIITPPISVRPPATQPTNRAEPKVYLSGEMMAMNMVDQTLQAPPIAPEHAWPLCPPIEFYPFPCPCPWTPIPLGHSQLNQVPWRTAHRDLS